MSLTHQCSQCGWRFAISRETRLPTGWSQGDQFQVWRNLRDGVSLSQQINEYTMVECPNCRWVESDPRIRVFGFIPVRLFLGSAVGFLLLVVALMIFSELSR